MSDYDRGFKDGLVGEDYQYDPGEDYDRGYGDGYAKAACDDNKTGNQS